LATNLASLQSIGVKGDATTFEEVTASIAELRAGISTLRAALVHDAAISVDEEATHAQGDLLPAMAAVRSASDQLEALVADDLWPLATYQEMLYIL
jgi:glutamine synthetase